MIINRRWRNTAAARNENDTRPRFGGAIVRGMAHPFGAVLMSNYFFGREAGGTSPLAR